MEYKDAAAGLAALAQETRLCLVRRLMEAGPAGLAAGQLAAALGIAAPDVPSLAAAAATQWTGGFNPRPVAVADLADLYEAVR